MKNDREWCACENEEASSIEDRDRGGRGRDWESTGLELKNRPSQLDGRGAADSCASLGTMEKLWDEERGRAVFICWESGEAVENGRSTHTQ